MHTRISVIVTVALTIISISLMGQSTGQIPGSVKGTVFDDSGKPVVRARVFISRALPASTPRPSAPPVITGPHLITTMTDQTGSFVSGHLATGDYVACAQPETAGLLDPCHWGASAPEFTVTSGNTTTGVNITLTKGAVVPIHLTDPSQLLTAPVSATASDCVFYVVTAKGYHYAAPIVAHSSTSRDHAITVPFGTPLTLKVISPNLVISDETGKAAALAGVALSVPFGANPTALTYTVSGKKQ